MKKLILVMVLFSEVCGAATRVAFFRMRAPNGGLIQLEQGGEFFHLAIQLEDGRWLHSHPYRGVEATYDLEKIGSPAAVLSDENGPAITLAQAEKYLGMPFNHSYIWEDPNSTYCAKLIGTLLGIQPKPMTFSSPFWDEHGIGHGHGVGLSPDDIYAALKARDFREIFHLKPCEQALQGPVLADMMEAK